ncbi:MAG: MFS transporter [Clostridia bacterium]|nr:MFS transporter [Clostridia bacterium]
MSKLRFRHPNIEPDWLKFTVLQFTYWFAMAIGNYQTVYLQDRGFAASTIGLINAVLSAVTIVVTPIWGMISDRIRSIRKVFLLTLVMGAVLFLLIPTVIGLPMLTTPLMLLYLSLVYLFRNPSNSLMDNWLVRYSNQKQVDYGSIRAFGSLGFAICGVAISGVVSTFGTAWTFPVCSAMMMLVVLLSMRTDDVKPAPPAEDAPAKESFNPLALFKNYYFTTFLAYAVLQYIVTNCVTAFLPYLLDEIDVASSNYGVITAYMAMLEIPMLIAARSLRQRVPLYAMAAAGGLCFAIACTLLGTCAHSLIAVIVIETFSGVGNGLMIASNANYIYTLTPENLKATGQSLYIAATSLSGIVGNLVGGAIIDALGPRSYYGIMGAMALVAVSFLLVTILLGRKREATGARG